ncbi:MAG: putative hydroxymethylpyrimidine transporter CytX, partial [Gemmiger sp.]|nr:putative hydroxymethylpyrimidine transporter CytX [Gemmiger sp.]
AIGFAAYRLLMGVDTPVGYTLPDMVLTVLLCLAAEKLKPTRAKAV